MKSNWQYLLLAFILAVFSWHLVSGREKVDTWIQMPVEMVNVPQGYVVRQGMVNRIEVRIRGPRPMIRSIDMKNAFYPLNLSGLQLGVNILDFESANIPLSRAIEVMEIMPPRVELMVDRLVSRTVPVEADYEVQLHEDYELKRLVLNPDSVTLRGPQEVVDQVETLKTQPARVPEEKPTLWESPVGLVLPAEVEASPARVGLQMVFGEKTEEKTIQVPVRVPELEGRVARVKPSKIQLVLEMPVSLARDKNIAEKFRVMPEDLGLFEPGTYQLGYRVTIPPATVLIKTEPELITVTIEAEEAGKE